MKTTSCLFIFLGLNFIAFSQNANYADAGSGSMRNYINWFDWTGTTVSNGQTANFITPDGLTVTVVFSNVTGPQLTPYIMNTGSGGVLWNLYNFTNPAIKPVLLSQNTLSPVTFTMTVTATRNSIPVSFTLVAADADASDVTETTTFTTTGSAWKSIEFFRNSAQTTNPLIGCGSQAVTLSNTYGGSANSGQNSILATDAPGTLNLQTSMTRTTLGDMAVAFGIFSPVDRGDLPPSYGYAHHGLKFKTENSCNYNAPFPLTYQTPVVYMGYVPGDTDRVQTTDDDLNGFDEDGITSVSAFSLYNGSGSYSAPFIPVKILTDSARYIASWFDWNRDGVFTVNERQIAQLFGTPVAVSPNWSSLPVTLPAAGTKPFAFRFRISTKLSQLQDPTGYAEDGEVEDYLVPYNIILPCPSFTLGPDRSICKGDSLFLNAGYAASSYIWQDGTNSPGYMVKDSGLYYVTLTLNGCSGSDSIQITLSPDPVVNVMADTSICDKQTVLIQTQAAGNYTYSWTPATGLSDATVPSPVATVNSTVKYVLTATNSFNCKAKDSITITSKPLPIVDLGKDTVICPSQPIVLDAQNSGSSYLWNNGINAQTLVVNAAGLYFVAVTKDGCTASDSILVSIKQKNFTLTPSSGLVCKDDSIRFMVKGGNNFTWYKDGAPMNLFDSSVLVFGTTPAIYSVQVTENKCGYSELMFIPLLLKPAPVISISKSNDISCTNPRAQLTAKGGVSYKWLPGTSISNDVVANPFVNPATDTWYSVTVTGLNGCSATDSIQVKTAAPYNGNFYVPTAFTPNSDGRNDCLAVKYAGVVTKFNFSVYTRWGDLVFQSTNLNQCWDGKFHNADANMGVYVYFLEASNNCGSITQKGTITLLR